MENPATWGQAERIIHGVLERWREHQLRDQLAGTLRCGASLERQIADALREAGQIGTGTPPGHYDDLAKRFQVHDGV